MKKVHTLIIGSGAAGLCAAVRLRAEGIDDILIATEGFDKGTSINTGSDKQTYYKLSLCGDESDSPRQMAETLFEGGSMHGDIALVEASLSARCFLHLVDLGVKFPTDSFGQFVGYKTDHDPRQRATSVGPYTSRDMCLALIRRVKELEIPVWERVCCVELLKIEQNGQDRVCGAIFIDENNETVPVIAENVVFAVGGPGALFKYSVYPKCQTGGIGLALAIGAEAQNLAEFQFGLASTKFRWNVSGTYMQVIPRFVSRSSSRNDPREFLPRSYKGPLGELYSKVFLKGYQWPFDARKAIDGSSQIDIFVDAETSDWPGPEGECRIYLDYRTNPQGLRFEELDPEAYGYLEKSGALFGTPIERLEKMNPAAIELYAANGIDLRKEMLEIGVCAQHNNGGLAGTVWWESTNIKHLFPIGEVNGSHGVARPGGSALNAGQVGAFRAAEFIAHRYSSWTVDPEILGPQIEETVEKWDELKMKLDFEQLPTRRELIQGEMGAGFLRPAISSDPMQIKCKIDRLKEIYDERMPEDGTANISDYQLCFAAMVYCSAIAFASQDGEDGPGSRGSALVYSKENQVFPENESFRQKVMLTRYDPETEEISHRWEPVRPIPSADLWFETEWRKYRNGEIYDE